MPEGELENISHSNEAAVTSYELIMIMLLLVVWTPFPGIFPEVGDATVRQQFQEAQGTHN